MAAARGVEGAGLAQPDIAAQLAAHPASFGFFQAVRLLERLYPTRARVGEFGNPEDEVAHFGANPSLAFPASEIEALSLPSDRPARLLVNFMGLIGPLGVLPYHFTQLVAERLRARDRALAGFLNMFQHRIISLFYRAWQKQHFPADARREGTDRVTGHLLDLVGLGLPGDRNHLPVPDEALVFYAGAVAPQPRSAIALQQLLEDCFNVPVEVEQFVGGWYPLSPDNQCRVGNEAGAVDQLALGAVVGDEVWDQQARVRLRLGPLTREQYDRFLPTGSAYRLLGALARFFSHDQFDFEVQLVMARKAVPACRLGAEGEAPATLGWGTWLGRAVFARDPDETVLTL